MKARYRLFRRGTRGGAFYCVDTRTGKRTSLGTSNEDEASQIIEAKNQSERQPLLNLQIAKAYLAGTDNGITTRTWKLRHLRKDQRIGRISEGGGLVTACSVVAELFI